MAGRRLTLLATLCVLLGACAAPAPFIAEGARLDLPPYVAAEDDPGDVEVIWGGLIVGIKPWGEDGSEVEVDGYPLDRHQRPITRAPSQGRFVIRVPAKLDRLDAPEGRYLTVRGHLIGAYDGYVGRTHHRYPILVDARWALWKAGFQFEQVHWAVGVGVAL